QEHIKRATLIATVCVGLGQVSCEALTDKLFFDESFLWLLFVPPLVALTIALSCSFHLRIADSRLEASGDEKADPPLRQARYRHAHHFRTESLS
ncbi:hypothetical protein PENTCL1PPCAC_20722, partial [Pristionchus entomophagus]